MKINRPGNLRPKVLILLLLASAMASVVFDVVRNAGYRVYPGWPPRNVKYSEDHLYHDLVADSVEINWNRLNTTLENMDDFRMVSIIRILFEYSNQIPDTVMRKIEKSLTGFRYWWDEPGGNSMFLGEQSENKHHIQPLRFTVYRGRKQFRRTSN